MPENTSITEDTKTDSFPVEPTEFDKLFEEAEKPETGETADSEDKGSLELEEKVESLGDIDLKALTKHAKSQGIEDLSQLSERELKLLKSSYDSKKAFHEKSQAEAALRKEQEEKAFKVQQESATVAKTELDSEYENRISELKASKAAFIKQATPALIEQGYKPEDVAAHLTEVAAQIYDTEKAKIDSEFNQKAVETQTKLKEAFESKTQKAFSELEESIQDDLKDPLVKHLFNSVKTKTPSPEAAEYFKNFLLSEIKEYKKAEDELKAKQINAGKAKAKDSQASINGNTPSPTKLEYNGTGIPTTKEDIIKFLSS